MPIPTEQKTFQAQLFACAEAIGWTIVSGEEVELLPSGRSAVFRARIENQKEKTLWLGMDF